MQYIGDWIALRRVCREFWSLQGLMIVEHAAWAGFYGLFTRFVLFGDHLDDTTGAWMMTLWGGIGMLSALVAGQVADWLGVRRALLVAFGGTFIVSAVCGCGSFIADPAARPWLVIVAICVAAPFRSMIGPATQAGIRRFTTERTCVAGFYIAQPVYAVGAFLGGLLAGPHDFWTKHVALAMLVAAALALLCGAFAFFLIRRADQRVESGPAPEVRRMNPWRNTVAVLTSPVFWRLFLLRFIVGLTLIAPYCVLFICPKFWYRVIGEDMPRETFDAVDYGVFALAVIAIIPIVHRFHGYRMLVAGLTLAALGLLVLGIPGAGGTVIGSSMVALVLVNIGFALLTPRLRAYAAEVAPHGLEGTFWTLSGLAFGGFLAKLAVSTWGGNLLQRWCPEYPPDAPAMGERIAAGEIAFLDSPSIMWILLGGFALIGPIVLWLLRKWLTKGTPFA